MAKYIEKEALKNRLRAYNCTSTSDNAGYSRGLNDALHHLAPMFIAEQPAADVAPVVHGRWIPKNSRNPFSWRYCSECKHTVTAAQARVYAGCPICLARMDGE